ncbi:unnamed protein product [Ambrosiozyma monospora]|uniref:Unnamed protein product n=1 Tax=Ambrosiozyma monospora TaxID=43982 RepID=A0A9W7DN27_AMBMO|nr:unnamed protein product [Ambrosiozyma monospora]
MIITSTVFSTLFGLGLGAIGLFAAIGLFPVFLIMLSTIMTLIAVAALTYAITMWVLGYFELNLPARSMLTFFADRIPPSVGIIETSESKKEPKKPIKIISNNNSRLSSAPIAETDVALSEDTKDITKGVLPDTVTKLQPDIADNSAPPAEVGEDGDVNTPLKDQGIQK